MVFVWLCIIVLFCIVYKFDCKDNKIMKINLLCIKNKLECVGL